MGYLIKLFNFLILITFVSNLELNYDEAGRTIMFINIPEPHGMNVQNCSTVVLLNCSMPKFTSDTLDHLIRTEFYNGGPKEYATYSELKNLYIINSEVKEFSENAFSEFKQLAKLDISNNNLEELNNNLFSGLNHLYLIDASNNNIKKLNGNVFSNDLELSIIHLTNNSIRNFNLINFPRFTYLYLNLNELETIGDKFLKCANVSVLSLKANNISQIESKFFETCESLKELYLTYNYITDLAPMTHSKLFKLELLDLSHNKISIVKSNFFKSFIELIVLNLSYNLIESIEEESFTNLHALIYLDLTANKIKFLNSNIFQKLINLKKVVLSNNNINNIDPAWLDYFNLLNSLNLSKKAIQNLNVEVFIDLTFLEIFDICFNYIKSHSNIFQNAPSLDSTYLNNRIQNLETKINAKILIYVDNNYNKFLCDALLNILATSKKAIDIDEMVSKSAEFNNNNNGKQNERHSQRYNDEM